MVRDHPVADDGVTVRPGGLAMVNAQINSQLQHDLLLMESIAIPLSFLVLVWVFGGLLAAALPVAVGLMAILGSMAVLRLIAFGTDVSIFALNLSTAMGLALAIDYTLLIISRYRDELADGADRERGADPRRWPPPGAPCCSRRRRWRCRWRRWCCSRCTS